MKRKLPPVRILILFLLLQATPGISFAQEYVVKKGSISFNITTPAGNLDAVDSIVTGNVNLRNGETFISCMVNDFHFITAFRPVNMNETATKRFREYYMETDQYPRAVFKGKIHRSGKIDLSKEGTYPLQADGKLTLHGVTKEVSFTFLLTIKGAEIQLQADKPISIADYNIRIPSNGISYFIFKEVNVHLKCSLQKK